MISILYVDDQEELLDVGKRFLEKSGEISADTCPLPDMVMNKIQQKSYDAIISDYEMPGMDGLTLLKNIRNTGNTIPFIIFTGKGREEVVIEALNNGADFYLQKGGDPKSQFIELIHKVNLAIKGRKAEQEIASHIRLVKRIAEISTRLMTTPPNQLHAVIHEALGEIGVLCRSDRCYIIEWDDGDRNSISATHEWCNAGVPESSGYLRHQPAHLFAWYLNQLNRNLCIHIQSICEIDESESRVKARLIDQGIKSFLHVPLIVGDTLSGILGLDAVFQEMTWTEEEMDTLRIFGQAILNALVRKAYVKELSESEARYRSVVESQTEFICRYRPDGVHLFVNEAYCRYFGVSREEIIGRNFTPEIPVEELKDLKQYFLSLTPDHPDGFIEHRIILPDKSIRWHQWTDHAIFDENGICVEYQSVGRDITDRKNVEICLSKSEELYRTIFESTGTAMMILDEDMTILSVNHELERVTGYSREEIEQKLPWTVFIHPDDVTRMSRYHKERRQEGNDVPTQYEFTFVTRDNKFIDSCITVGMIPKTNHSIASIIDISKLSLTKATLAESEEKFRTLAESLSLGVYIIQDERFIYVNRYISSIFGYPDTEIYSQPLFSFFSESDNVIIRNAMEKRVSGNGQNVKYQAHAKTKTGSLVEVEIQGTITFYLGKPAFIGIIRSAREIQKDSKSNP